jgi:hypothetical protein
MKKPVMFSIILLISLVQTPPAYTQASALISDHLTAKLSMISEGDIALAKSTLHIAYGHTSHGSQIITGMEGLLSFKPGYDTLFTFNDGGVGGALDLRDTPFSGASDLGNPDRTSWATATRNYLNIHSEVNVIIWSWCGQVSSATEADINTYLNLVDGLEQDYPNVSFVYMTGHLDGGGLDRNLNLRNEQIRNYCKQNNKILYDFADIESYDPDGNYFLDKLANDNCDYDSDGNGSLDKNWAIQWQNAHPGEWYNCSPAHTQPLNGNLKAYAAWYLWCAIAQRRNGETLLAAPTNLQATAISGSQINLAWTDNSYNEDGFKIERAPDNGGTAGTFTEIATVGTDVASFNDTGLTEGTTYYYQVRSYNSEGDSNYSNIAMATTKRVTLLSPNGGEVLIPSAGFLVQWESSPEAVKFKLFYSLNNGNIWSPITKGCISGTSTTWNVPALTKNATNCLVKIVGYNASNKKIGKDRSDGNFIIEVMNVLTPNGGETCTSGQPCPVTWETNVMASIIQLHYSINNGVTWKAIPDIIPGDQTSYDWTSPTVKKTFTKCKVKVVLKDSEGKKVGSDVSDSVLTITP